MYYTTQVPIIYDSHYASIYFKNQYIKDIIKIYNGPFTNRYLRNVIFLNDKRNYNAV